MFFFSLSLSLSRNFFFWGAPGGLDCFYGGLFFVTSCALQLKAKCIFLCFLLCSCYASGSFWREWGGKGAYVTWWVKRCCSSVGFGCFQNNELLVPICVTCYHFVSCFCSDVNFHYFRSSRIRKQYTSVSPVALCQTNWTKDGIILPSRKHSSICFSFSFGGNVYALKLLFCIYIRGGNFTSFTVSKHIFLIIWNCPVGILTTNLSPSYLIYILTLKSS